MRVADLFPAPRRARRPRSGDDKKKARLGMMRIILGQALLVT